MLKSPLKHENAENKINIRVIEWTQNSMFYHLWTDLNLYFRARENSATLTRHLLHRPTRQSWRRQRAPPPPPTAPDPSAASSKSRSRRCPSEGATGCPIWRKNRLKDVKWCKIDKLDLLVKWSNFHCTDKQVKVIARLGEYHFLAPSGHIHDFAQPIPRISNMYYV